MFISCGGVEITQVNFNDIAKKTASKKPILEEYRFVPNETTLSIEESIRVNMQLALEYNKKNKIKIVDVSNANRSLLSTIIKSMENDPFVEIDAILLTKNKIAISQVKVEDVPLESLEDIYMVIGQELLTKEKLEKIFGVLTTNGFILSRESLSTNINLPHLNVLTNHLTPNERLILVTKTSFVCGLYKTIEITNSFEWIKPLQEVLKTDDEIVIYSRSENTGILGLCKTLRREGKNIRCAINCDAKKDYLMKGFATNVFKNGKWGSYRSLPIKLSDKIGSEHCFMDGNLEWITGPLNSKIKLTGNEELVHVSTCRISLENQLYKG